jgi:hypothetical protein
MLANFLTEIKMRCGIPPQVMVYDAEIAGLLEDCEQDMLSSGVDQLVIESTQHMPQVITAAALYVKANIGNDRSDTSIYMDLYQKKVFRLTLEGEENVE